MLDFLFEAAGQESHFLSGAGMAAIFLGEDKGFGVPSWLVTGIHAEVRGASTPAPVPEPATLLLAGSCMGWMALRRRRT
jgi:hypothetical protein